jgi:hypothetical protein
MSNLWKLYGLAYSRRDFFEQAQSLALRVRPRAFDNDGYQTALAEIDQFLFKWYSPLDHLDAQLFYDLLCCQTLWDNFAHVLELSGLDTSSIHPADADAGVFWQVLGLACLDPWKNQQRDGSEHVGFRQLLQKDVNAAEQLGFRLSDHYKKMLTDVLAKPNMLEALQSIAMCWDPASKSMLLNREEYSRLQPIEIPQGWIDLTKP